ncbi:hypothetical protein L596_019922 [Steinernema carpocapsae]|nr:hypothetical protein L596_019922 [Steinernema carpocapsae]
MCFIYQDSSTFKRLSDHTASDLIQPLFDTEAFSSFTFATRKAPTCFLGTIGLAQGSKARYPGETVPYERWIGGKPINAFSLYYANCGGSIGFGTNYACDVNNDTLYLNTTSEKYWQFEMDGVELEDVKIAVKSQAVINTVKDYIGMPKKFLKEFTSKYSIPWDGLYGAYTVPCNATSYLPDLNFKAQNGILTIKATHYVYTEEPLPNGKCVLDFEDSQAFGFGPEWYFGLQIIQDYCVGFSWPSYSLKGWPPVPLPGVISFTKNSKMGLC